MAEETKDKGLGWKFSRRSFLQWSAILGAATATGLTVAGCGGSGGPGGSGTEPAVAQAGARLQGTKVIPTSCIHNCGGRCPLHAHVKDGVVVQLTTDDSGPDTLERPQVRACLRGRSQRKRLYHPDRLKYPMKRTGERGEGKFEKISWDEALDTIASEMKRVKEKYGNEAFDVHYASGVLTNIGMFLSMRLFNLFGGYLNMYGTYSAACYEYVTPYMFGIPYGNSVNDVLNSKLIVLFSFNPGENALGGANVMHYLREAKKRGAKVIVIDPRYTDTAQSVADQWIPIRPTTDCALISALAYVMIKEGLYRQDYMDKYCVGFDEAHMPPGIPKGNSYKSYILGESDGTPKTPEWASPITGVPVNTIYNLAREIATIKPCCLWQYFGWQRSAYGEQPPRALPVLAVMTGNIGLAGGGPGLIPTEPGIPIGFLPTGQNPVKAAIPTFKWTEAIERGVEFDFKHDGLKGVDKLSTNLKFIWNYAGNALVNQHADCGRTAKLLRDTKKCEFIVTIDNFLTPSARFSDIVLPETTHFEREDIVSIYTFGGHAIYLNKVVEPMYECRNLYDICADIAGRLGFKEAFTEGKTQEQWVEELCRQAEKLDPNFHFEEFKRTGIYKINRKPVVAYADFIKDPDKNPLKTPSGKIEIFVKDFYDFGNPKEVPAIPKYISAWEGPEDPLREKYPLQCIGFHYKRRAHSTFDNIAWLDEAGPQVVWINPKDAQARGIKNGDQVKVFNDRGTIIMPAKVTPRIMPGVVAIPQGAWYSPDANGVDHRGCINVITTWRPTPLAKGNPQHTNLVEIHKA